MLVTFQEKLPRCQQSVSQSRNVFGVVFNAPQLTRLAMKHLFPLSFYTTTATRPEWLRMHERNSKSQRTHRPPVHVSAHCVDDLAIRGAYPNDTSTSKESRFLEPNTEVWMAAHVIRVSPYVRGRSSCPLESLRRVPLASMACDGMVMRAKGPKVGRSLR